MRCFAFFLALTMTGPAWAQQAPSSSPKPPAKAPAKKAPAAAQPTATPPKSDETSAASSDASPDADIELQMAVRSAGNDSATLIKTLEAYLVKYPDSPRRGAIYRALTESEMNLHNPKSALEYAEKTIAIQPKDSQTMFLAVTLLEKTHDDASQLRAIDYDTRLLERVSKADPDARPQQMTLDDWQSGRNKFLVNLYVMRGHLQHNLHKNDDAVKDLKTAFQLVPNAEAALSLGEIAEENRHSDEAIHEYAMAFVLSSQEPADAGNAPLDLSRLRSRMGNLWRFTHDSNTGLGDLMLQAYDRNREVIRADKFDELSYNKDVTDPLQFSLRRVDGSGTTKLADSRGKVVVVNFWTTWCAYCTQMNVLLADVRSKFSGRDDVQFVTINADEDEAGVALFVKDQKPAGTPVFADGVNHAFHVESIPTVLVLDKGGKIAYRTQGFAPDGFAELAAAAIAKASAAPAP